MDEGGEALASAISKNVRNGGAVGQALRLAAYARAAEAALGQTDEAALKRAAFRFPSPRPEAP